MPFPATLEQLEKSGYRYARMEVCKDCGQSVEVFTTPAKREVGCNPMPLITDPAVEHWRTCKPVVQLPKTRDELQAAGYEFLGRVTCGQCKRATDLYKHNGEQIPFDPMMEADWPVIIHDCKSVQSRTEAKHEPQVSGPENPPPEVQQEQGGASEGPDGAIDAIKLHGVTDPNFNIIAVGYEPVGGILVCQWKAGKGYHTGVPEDVYQKLLSARFAYRQYTLTVKGKFPYTKLA